jgi:hypothetical protein
LIPKEVIGEGTGFHKEFFANLWKGLSSENFSDSSATRLITAYMECLLYFISLDLYVFAFAPLPPFSALSLTGGSMRQPKRGPD